MADLNKTIKDISSLKEKVKKDLHNLTQMYGSLKDNLDRKFREEVKSQKGDYKGLEDFYALVMMVKKDTGTSSNLLGLLRRLNDLSDFNISEIEDNIELNEIFESNK